MDLCVCKKRNLKQLGTECGATHIEM